MPESHQDFRDLAEAGAAKFSHCFDCKSPFNSINTQTAAGWRETQISGICETCYDQLFSEGEENVR